MKQAAAIPVPASPNRPPAWVALGLGSFGTRRTPDFPATELEAALAGAAALGFQAVTLPIDGWLRAGEPLGTSASRLAARCRELGLTLVALELALETFVTHTARALDLCPAFGCWRLTLVPPRSALEQRHSTGLLLDLLAYRARARSVRLGYRASEDELRDDAAPLAQLCSSWSCSSIELILPPPTSPSEKDLVPSTLPPSRVALLQTPRDAGSWSADRTRAALRAGRALGVPLVLEQCTLQTGFGGTLGLEPPEDTPDGILTQVGPSGPSVPAARLERSAQPLFQPVYL